MQLLGTIHIKENSYTVKLLRSFNPCNGCLSCILVSYYNIIDIQPESIEKDIISGVGNHKNCKQLSMHYTEVLNNKYWEGCI